MIAYYNETDPYCVEWLSNLIAENALPYGHIDNRPIQDVTPNDVSKYDQCHFFAGIGGWPLAAQIAGWPNNQLLWTGSCPCQPFSEAGYGKGVNDERHVWPFWRWLIQHCQPTTIIGEQVASKAGRRWLAGVRADLEALGYAVGAADLCAASVGAPHTRQRLWWMGHTDKQGLEGHSRDEHYSNKSRRHNPVSDGQADSAGSSGSWLADTDTTGRPAGRLHIRSGQSPNATLFKPWVSARWIDCADKKARRIEPSIEPLADGIPARVGRVRAYGNAIVPQVAAEVLAAFMEAGG